MNRLFRHAPNVLTALRLAAAPVTAALLTGGHFHVAFGVFAFAGLSDAADGFLAKRFGLSSELGRYLDPAADKALMLAALVTLSVLNVVPVWLTALVLSRDLLIVLGILAAFAVGAPLAVQPLLVGKLSTVVQILYVGVHLGELAFALDLGLAPYDDYALVAVTLASGVAYLALWWRTMRAGPNNGA